MSQNENIETEIRLLANECLGYFGPLNLKTMTLYFDEITDSKEALIRILLEYVTNSDAKVSEAAIYGLKRVLCSNIDKGSIPEVLEPYLQPFQNSFQQSKEKPNCDVLLKAEDLSEAVRIFLFFSTFLTASIVLAVLGTFFLLGCLFPNFLLNGYRNHRNYIEMMTHYISCNFL